MPKPKGMQAGSPDDFQTTDPDAIKCLVPFLPPYKKVIWEPACGEGYIIQHLQGHGFDVFGTDIKLGEEFDFMKYVPPANYDMIITNPPFSIKEKFLARCYALEKPFALLMPLTTFDSEERRLLFSRHGVEIVMPPKRLSFETPPQTAARKAKQSMTKKSGAWFYSCWFTWGLKIGCQLNFTDERQHGILL